MPEQEIHFGDIFIYNKRDTRKVIVELANGVQFGACTLRLEDGSCGMVGTNDVRDIEKIIGRMTLNEITEAVRLGMIRMGENGITDHQIGVLQREAEKGSRIIIY